MKRILTTEASEYIGQRVRLSGWLHNVRRLGGVNFIVLRDGWGLIQAVTEDEADLNELLAGGLSAETVITLEGVVVEAVQAPGGIELHRPRLDVITPVAEALPVQINKRKLKAGLATVLDHAVLTNRRPERRAIFRLAAGVMAGFRAGLNARGFTETQTPKIVASATESGANVFQLNYFGRPAYLAQSPQFYKQIMVGVFERGYEVLPLPFD